MHITPSKPSSSSSILFWNRSGVDFKPRGSRWRQYLPKGVRNVVRSWEFSASFSNQKPEFASIIVNTVDSPISPSKVSIFGSAYVSRQTFSSSFVRSTPIRMFPFELGTVTIPAHQVLGLSTFLITPSFYILASSSFTVLFIGNGIRPGVMIANGWASGFNWISFSFVRSTPIRMFPFELGTVTIPAHQFVGLSTFLITPSFSILASSGAPNVNFRKISVPKTIWDTEFSEHFV